MTYNSINEIWKEFELETNYSTVGNLIKKLDRFSINYGESRDYVIYRAHMLRRRGEWHAAALWLDMKSSDFSKDVDIWYEAALNYIDAGYYLKGIEFLDKIRPYIPEISEGHLRGMWRASAIAGGHVLSQEAFDEATRRASPYATDHVRSRILSAVEMSNKQDFRLISIGENCLPWMLGNRWGLRNQPYNSEYQWIFNLGQTSTNFCADIIAKRGVGFLDNNNIHSIYNPSGAPYPENVAFGYGFNHELGEEWIEDNFRKLHEKYKPMIENTSLFSKGSKRIFFHYTENSGDFGALIKSLDSFNQDKNFRLVIVDVSNNNSTDFIHEKNVFYLNIKIPRENYLWFKPDDYDSEEGVNFELQIRDFLIESSY
jgi:hypothetical protein